MSDVAPAVSASRFHRRDEEIPPPPRRPLGMRDTSAFDLDPKTIPSSWCHDTQH